MMQLMRVRFVILAGLILLPQLGLSQTMSCESLSTFVADSSKRYSGHGFTILPPSSGYWCSLGSESTLLSFMSNKFLGTEIVSRPEREEVAHSFATVAMAISIKEADRGRFSSLKEFVEVWIERGSRGFDIYGPVIYSDLSPQENFSVARSEVRNDDEMQTECVRYELAVEERKNPGVPRRWVLVTTAEGILCRHPEDENLLIDVAFSERKRQGWEDADTGLATRLRAQAQSALNSLLFTAIEPLEIEESLQVARGRELQPGVAVVGSLSAGRPKTPNDSYYESWHIRAEAGQRLDVSMKSDEFDAMLIIGRDVDGVFGALAGDDDSGRRQNARLKYKVPEAGAYIVMALSATPGEVGSYTLEVK